MVVGFRSPDNLSSGEPEVGSGCAIASSNRRPELIANDASGACTAAPKKEPTNIQAALGMSGTQAHIGIARKTSLFLLR